MRNPKKYPQDRRKRPVTVREVLGEGVYQRSDGSIVERVPFITKEEKQFCRVVNKMFLGLGI